MRPNNAHLPKLTLDYPMSLGVFSEYEEAQRAVDYLSDHEFPVQQCMIVGTDLKQVERITGRLTWGRVLLGGLASGAWLGAFVGLIFSLFSNENGLSMILSTVLLGALFGAFWAAIGYAATRGRRDFTSVSQVVATKYEVLVEHKSVNQARELLSQMGGDAGRAARAAQEAAYAPRDAGPQRTYSESLNDGRGGATAQPTPERQQSRPATEPRYGQYAPQQPQQPQQPETPNQG